LVKFDQIDLRILSELSNEANISIPKLSEKMNVNMSVVYSRIKRLIDKGFIKKYTLEINEELLGYPVRAIIGCNIDSKQRKDIINNISSIEEAREIIEITGRFDLLIWLSAKSLKDLHSLVSEKVAQIEGLTHTETFIEMNRKKLSYITKIQTDGDQ
jgi:Lrp/AsnC family transcriptional regulator for asnA, asnC and gidA|tara:strand:- start:692 stop:1162 length:471 start_codon:yes stop_codon:yes gene_type:complete